MHTSSAMFPIREIPLTPFMLCMTAVTILVTLAQRRVHVQGGPKKLGHGLMTIILSNRNRLKKFTGKFLGKFVVKWILILPLHLEYAATLPCNLSLTACFADIYILQGCVATYSRCGGSFNIHLTANLPGNLPAKEILKSVKI